ELSAEQAQLSAEDRDAVRKRRLAALEASALRQAEQQVERQEEEQEQEEERIQVHGSGDDTHTQSALPEPEAAEPSKSSDGLRRRRAAAGAAKPADAAAPLPPTAIERGKRFERDTRFAPTVPAPATSTAPQECMQPVPVVPKHNEAKTQPEHPDVAEEAEGMAEAKPSTSTRAKAPANASAARYQKLLGIAVRGSGPEDTEEMTLQLCATAVAAHINAMPVLAQKLQYGSRVYAASKRAAGEQAEDRASAGTSAALQLEFQRRCVVAPLAGALGHGERADAELLDALVRCKVASALLGELLERKVLTRSGDRGHGGDVWGAVEGVFVALMARLRASSVVHTVEVEHCAPLLRAFGVLTGVPSVSVAIVRHAAAARAWVPPPRPSILLAPGRAPSSSCTGRDLEAVGLGPLFSHGALPDCTRVLAGMRHAGRPADAFEPGVLGERFFPGGLPAPHSIGRRGECAQEQGDVRRESATVQRELGRVVRSLLRPATRDAMLDWLSAATEANANRAKEYADHFNDSGDNFMLNVAAVLLRLCEPFTALPRATGGDSEAQDKVDSVRGEYAVKCRRHVVGQARCSYDAETKFAVSSDELDAWVDKRNLTRIKLFEAKKAKEQTASCVVTGDGEGEGTARGEDSDDGDAMDALLEAEEGDDDDDDAMDALLEAEGDETHKQVAEAEAPAERFSFVTECFFLTARALHHGFIPTMKLSRNTNMQHGTSTYMSLLTTLGPMSHEINALQRARQHEMAHALHAKYNSLIITKNLFEGAMLDPDTVLAPALRFYSFAARWLTRQALGAAYCWPCDFAALTLPLSLPPPIEFAYLPEHLGEDMAEFVQIARMLAPQALHGASKDVDGMLTLIVVLLGSPGYVRNPYLCQKFADVIYALVPDELKPRDHQSFASDDAPDFSMLLATNVLARRYLAAGLLRVYTDAENTGGHNQFHEKFPARAKIHVVLSFLCDDTQEEVAGSAVAPDDKARFHSSLVKHLRSHAGLRFVGMLLNDTTHAFDEALEGLKELKTLEDEELAGEPELGACLNRCLHPPRTDSAALFDIFCPPWR
ncbi:hypothetical protein OAN61_00635, partial [bacterium]|nr:hypothetical protein [bacterium]